MFGLRLGYNIYIYITRLNKYALYGACTLRLIFYLVTVG